MKTIDELAQVLLTVDNKLDLSDLTGGGLVVDDDLHRELYEAVQAETFAHDSIYENVSDESGYFTIEGESHALGYVCLEEGGVSWTIFNKDEA